ncbi:RHS repeat-associated core domain-containing protein [Pseudomonas fluorescens]|uniref:RHS repeat-associated core domain-containing protein n=1 Tax=Pseudomonas fluorescens TaxID=294 RepID=A0A5E7DAL4_PSEFL|nr:RHS repeat-associated core domain-containing protein [Pseudomonas fluorescens]VVO05124.1 hypothetical protein PS691_02941 [Pseudomonas fluorescens]
MPASPRETLLCHYHYDPLDRLADCTPFKQAGIQRFYCKTRLATEIQDAAQRSIFQHDDQLLAQQQSRSGKLDTTLLATDQQRSILNALDATQPHPLAYTPYGHRPLGNGLLSLLGFNGERPDPVTGHYHLGNGYRQFNPVLMRFNSPDSWSPFGKGGLNAYGYCNGDPRNRMDPSGHWSFKGILQSIGRNLRLRKSKKAANFGSNASKINKPATTPHLAGATQNSETKNAVNLWETNTAPNNNPTSDMNFTPKKTKNPLFTTPISSERATPPLPTRRSKSLDLTNIPNTSTEERQKMLLGAARNTPQGDYMISMFAGTPDTTHAKLYFAMNSELFKFPNKNIQRTIRTGGQK